MENIDASDIHRLNAALGWLGLGSPSEARVELEAIPPTRQWHPAVLETRWLLCAHEKNWDEALTVAEREVVATPDAASGWLHRAYALRRVPGGGLEQAWEALLPMAQKFPTEAAIAYNLSCYACQMNRVDVSREWFQRAVQMGGKDAMKKMALDDDDLKPLWPEIQEL